MAEEVLTYDKGDSVNLDGIALTKRTRGSIAAGSQALTVQDATGYAINDVGFVKGAGPDGADHVATVTQVAGNVLTLNTPASETVTRAKVGKLTNPSAQVCTVKRPDGTTSAPGVTVPSVGRLHAVYDIADNDPAGEYWWSYDTDGAARAYEARKFVVRERRAG